MDFERDGLAFAEEPAPDEADLSSDLPEFDAAYGEPFARTLDLSTWGPGEDLPAGVGRLEREVTAALAREDGYRAALRARVFPHLAEFPYAPETAGVYRALPARLEQIHRGLLFNRGVEAVSGLSMVHDTLPLSITQLGVCLVSYNGRQNSWAHRLYRRDLRQESGDLLDELITLLERREKSSRGRGAQSALSELARRGILAWAERAILLRESSAAWRLGRGSALPFELLSGLWASSAINLRIGLDLIAEYMDFGRFVFVSRNTRQRHFLMIGQALNGGEYAILRSMQLDVETLIARGHYRDESGVRPAMQEMCATVAPRLVVGVLRASSSAPPHLFYAHANYAHMAAHVAMADAQMQEYSGFPMLLELANHVCRATFGVDSLTPQVHTAYATSSEPLRYLGL